MTTRKPFGEFLKSQKNRRLKRDKNGSLLQQIPSLLLTRHDVNIFSDDKQDTADCTSFNNFTLPESSIEHQDDIISDDNGVDFIQMGISDRVLTVKDVDVGYSVQTKIIDPDTTIDLRTQIGQWQCQYNISQAATGSLLKMLTNVNSVDELKKLPKDSRTLLNTPQTTFTKG
ncbi:unnamed protein product [Brassicogethes aeneus]|uniref:Uncharacterized protein n=1 Tax=Brassicogethes aeneus TaxID=1431903 RepID=A0A9P0FD54_BRAAE|nr:unnamed protein product [Brassicogethes aeneus]